MVCCHKNDELFEFQKLFLFFSVKPIIPIKTYPQVLTMPKKNTKSNNKYTSVHTESYEAAECSSEKNKMEVPPSFAQEVDVSKGFTRPQLLTLGGLYATTKTLCSTYVPESAAKVITSISVTLFKASSPYVIKALPDSASSEWKCLENGELESIDNLFMSYFTAGDAVIDLIVSDTKGRVTNMYTTNTEKLSAKVDSWVENIFMLKNFFHEKVENVKPEVMSKLDGAKAAVQAKMDDEKVVAIIDKAQPYINLVKTNVDPAKDIVSEYAANAKAEVDAKGYMGFAKESADSIREQSFEAFETCKTLGAVEGVKEISHQVLSNVANKFEGAKVRKQSEVSVEVEETVEKAAAVAAEVVKEVAPVETEEFTSASEDDTN